jgi:hypothetical protein
LALADGYIMYGGRAIDFGGDATAAAQGYHIAEGLLDKAEKLPGQVGELCLARLRVAIQLGHPWADLDKLLRRALEVVPAWREPIKEIAWHLLPERSGQPGELEKFADEAAELTKPQQGSYGYARVVETASIAYGEKVFHVFRFSWPKTRQAMDDAMQRYPHSQSLLNSCCFLACVAGDRAKAHELFQSIGQGKVDPNAWQERRIREYWRKWARRDPKKAGGGGP